MLQAFFALQFLLLFFAFLLQGSIIGKKIKLFCHRFPLHFSLRHDMICSQIHPPDQKLFIDNAVIQCQNCIQDLPG